MSKAKKTSTKVEDLNHPDATRINIPSAEFQPLLRQEELNPIQSVFERRNPDLDPQLVWRGKDTVNWSDLVVQAPPLYIQERIRPKVLIDDLRRQSASEAKQHQSQTDLFADFNGLPSADAKTEFYQHDAHWSNRMILGDSLQVMASLAEREGLRGKVQCIYFDPPYGIKFNSNFQWSTTSRDVRDGNTGHITREPEQVKAFRDTWRDGIHSYLTYLRDRLTVARDLLHETGSIFVQIGDENVHRVRTLMDEVFGDGNFSSLISYATTSGFETSSLSRLGGYILWYAKDLRAMKYRPLYFQKNEESLKNSDYRNVELPDLTRMPISQVKPNNTKGRVFRFGDMTGQGASSSLQPFQFQGKQYLPPLSAHWKANYPNGIQRLAWSNRIQNRPSSLAYIRYIDDFGVMTYSNVWTDTSIAGSKDGKIYVVQTNPKVIERCMLMTTDPGDLVLDPTCGSGTTAYVAEQWGRRWMTIDTSRVALALARARIMGARYPYYLLVDSAEGQQKEAVLSKRSVSSLPTYENVRLGFVYERVSHITLKSIANNTEIDVIWDKYQLQLEPVREELNAELEQKWQEWEIPREAAAKWSTKAQALHSSWWEKRIDRQREMDASIAAKAEYEFLYDKPYEDKKTVRVAGPFTVESLSPHRVLSVGANDEVIDPAKRINAAERNFVAIILETLSKSGVQQAHKQDKIEFTSLEPYPGDGYICAEGRYLEGHLERRAGIFIGPEFGTVTRPDLVAAVREAGEFGFDVVIACAFNFDAHSADLQKLGKIPVLKARMNADLHMAEDLKNTGKGNLFVIFGEPDIEIFPVENNQIQVRVRGIDVFDPSSGEVRSENADGIACWFIDSDYSEEEFFVRHAYFLGQSDPYKSLKTTLKAEINLEAWSTLNSDTSRPFDKPTSKRIAVKVINHLGDEVMKVFKVE